MVVLWGGSVWTMTLGRRITGIGVLLFVWGMMLPAMAQDGRVSVSMGDGVYEMIPIIVHGGTFAVKAEYDSYPKPQTRLLGYSATGVLLWDKTIQNNYFADSRKVKAIAPPYGTAVYTVEYSTNTDKPFDHYITCVSGNGEVRELSIEGGSFTPTLQSIFCDEQYLYYINKQGSGKQRGVKKEADQLVLNRFDLASSSHRQFQFQLPAMDQAKATFWTYIGQRGSAKYLLSKANDLANSRHWFNIAMFDQDANVLYNTRIDLALNNRYVRPAFTVSYPGGTFAPVVNPDVIEISDKGPDLIYDISRAMFRRPGHPIISRSLSDGAFTNLYLDEAHGYFYVYGLSGPEPFNAGHAIYDGFYIFKYALTGELVWKLEQLASSGLISQKDFYTRNAREERSIAINILPDETVNFSVQFSGMLFSHEISPEGRFVKEYQVKWYTDEVDAFARNSRAWLRGEEFAWQARKNLQETHYLNFITPAGEILMEYDKPAAELSVFYFKMQK